MPVEHKKYGCEFKCGQWHSPSHDKIAKHESQCWYNPDVRSCKTCKHEDYVQDYCEHPELSGSPTEWLGYYRGCKHPNNKDYTRTFPDSVGDAQHIPPVVNCSEWEAKK